MLHNKDISVKIYIKKANAIIITCLRSFTSLDFFALKWNFHLMLTWTWSFTQKSVIYIFYANTYSHNYTHTCTHTWRDRKKHILVLCPHCCLPCSVLRGSTLLNCIPQPIILMALHHGCLHAYTTSRSHTGSREENRHRTFFLPRVLILHDQRWQKLIIDFASLRQA